MFCAFEKYGIDLMMVSYGLTSFLLLYFLLYLEGLLYIFKVFFDFLKTLFISFFSFALNKFDLDHQNLSINSRSILQNVPVIQDWWSEQDLCYKRKMQNQLKQKTHKKQSDTKEKVKKDSKLKNWKRLIKVKEVKKTLK